MPNVIQGTAGADNLLGTSGDDSVLGGGDYDFFGNIILDKPSAIGRIIP